MSSTADTLTDPAPQRPTLSANQLRVLALAAVFASAQLVHVLAIKGSDALNQQQLPFDRLLRSALSAVDFADLSVHQPAQQMQQLFHLYDYPAATRLGLRTLESCCTQPFNSIPAPKTWPHREALQYALAMLSIERKIYRKPALVAHIHQQLPILRHRYQFFDHNIQHPALLAGMAQLYLDTAGKLSFRLKISGQQQHLTQPANIDRIRACLWAGVQAAHVWQQLGGRRWHLLFKRRQLLADLHELSLWQYRHS